MSHTTFFTDTGKARRQINLGGASSSITHATILDSVKSRRAERESAVQRSESAVKIQAWFRGRSASRKVKQELRHQFDTADGLNAVQWTRCLAVAWSGSPDDEVRLARWSSAMGADNNLIRPFATPDAPAWRVLLRQMTLILLKYVDSHPTSDSPPSYLAVIASLLDVRSLQSVLGEHGSTIPADFSTYLLHRGFYHHLSHSITQIPVEAKSSPSIPPLIALSLAPFSIFLPSTPQYLLALAQLTTSILTIPLLPNRIPIPSLTELSAKLPFSSLSALDLHALVSSLSGPLATSSSPSLSPQAHLTKINLLANVVLFGSSRLPKSNAQTLEMYIRLLTLLMDSVPPGSLEPAGPTSGASTSWAVDSDSDSSDDESRPSTSKRAKKASLPALDPKTQSRLHTIHSTSHLSSLLNSTSRHPAARSRLFGFFNSLWAVWPSRRDRVMSNVMNVPGRVGGGALIREVWREWVRRSALGKEEDPKRALESFTAPSNAEAWSPFLFLTDLYAHTLLTMGDDEFFSSSSSFSSSLPSRPSGSTSTPSNPLSLDELTAFSRQLLNVAFPLYWHEDQANVKERVVPGLGDRLTWEAVRDKVTGLLQAIHARDSRHPFTPADHWLVTGQIDLQSFVEAVVAEEQTLDRPAAVHAGSSHTRVLSKRQMAFISPRLGILNNIPFSIPFQTRVTIFQQFIANDAHRLGLDEYWVRPKYKATIRRKSVAQDGFDQLGKLGVGLKERVAITFIDEWGNEEAGIDGGGVFKEFVTSLTKEAFDTNRGLWAITEQQELFPAAHSYAKEPHQLEWYRFIGRVLGKALYEGILIDVAFAGFFLSKWLGKQSYLDDLQSLDPELYQGLVFLKHYDGKVEDLSLNFTVTNSEFGVTKSIDLIPGGSNIAVTKENRIQYIYLVANYKLNVQIKKQSEALFEGVSEMIDPKWLRMFNQQEVQILIGGVEEPVDIDDLMQNCIYGGVYDANHPVVQRFWKVAKTLNQNERQLLLRFVTSCSRPPLLGFKELNPRFSIRDAGMDDTRLPTSSTCVNLLKLPQYSSEAGLRQKLVQAITSNAGFDLS